MESAAIVTTAGSALAPTISYVEPGDRSPRARLIDLVERLSGRDALQDIYRQLKAEPFDHRTFFARALEVAEIRYETAGASAATVPASGPLVFVANHPFGIVDGLILCDIASRLRGEFRILIHALLCRDRELDTCFLPIDFRESRAAAATNIQSKREALATLDAGGVILVFPAGGISTRSRRGFGPLQDLPWSTFTAKLIRRSRATVVPVFFHGCNSRLFHVASGISASLRASLLLHEAHNKIGGRFRVQVGRPLGYEALAHLDRVALTRHLHDTVWGLRDTDSR